MCLLHDLDANGAVQLVVVQCPYIEIIINAYSHPCLQKMQSVSSRHSLWIPPLINLKFIASHDPIWYQRWHRHDELVSQDDGRAGS